MKILKKILWKSWLAVVLLGLWWVLSINSTSLYFPSLRTILQEFKDTWLFEYFWSDAVPSLLRLLIAFPIALIIGIGLGLFLGINRRAENALRPVIDFIRSTPSTALLPLLIMFLGTGSQMKVVMIAFVALFPIMLNTIDGVASVDGQLRKVAKVFHLNRFHQVLYILLPAASPQIFAGARVGLAIGFIAMVISEMVGRPGGIGYFILNSQRQFDMTAMWGGLVALGLLGFIANALFKIVEHRVLAWHTGMQKLHQEV